MMSLLGETALWEAVATGGGVLHKSHNKKIEPHCLLVLEWTHGILAITLG